MFTIYRFATFSIDFATLSACFFDCSLKILTIVITIWISKITKMMFSFISWREWYSSCTFNWSKIWTWGWSPVFCDVFDFVFPMFNFTSLETVIDVHFCTFIIWQASLSARALFVCFSIMYCTCYYLNASHNCLIAVSHVKFISNILCDKTEFIW